MKLLFRTDRRGALFNGMAMEDPHELEVSWADMMPGDRELFLRWIREEERNLEVVRILRPNSDRSDYIHFISTPDFVGIINSMKERESALLKMAKDAEVKAAAAAAAEAARAAAAAMLPPEPQDQSPPIANRDALVWSWAKENGSDGLKVCLQNGIDCEVILLREVVSKKYQPWILARDAGMVIDMASAATQEDLQILVEAEAVKPAGGKLRIGRPVGNVGTVAVCEVSDPMFCQPIVLALWKTAERQK